jgi:hypothetical protein
MLRHMATPSAVLKAALLAGTLDILVTGIKVIAFGTATAVRLLQSIASGLLGPDAFRGGLPVAALGAAIHFGIAAAWSTVFAVLATWLAPVRRVRTRVGVIAAGLAYGAVVWVMMDFVVLPLSRARSVPVSAAGFWIQLGIHMACVGVPIAWIVLAREPATVQTRVAA